MGENVIFFLLLDVLKEVQKKKSLVLRKQGFLKHQGQDLTKNFNNSSTRLRHPIINDWYEYYGPFTGQSEMLRMEWVDVCRERLTFVFLQISCLQLN